MITEKDIKKRIAEVLESDGFNVVAQEVDEGFKKPAVFVNVFPASAELMTHGIATEQITDSVEIKYISSLETAEDCIEASHRIKKLFLYQPFDIQDRHLTVQRIEFELEELAGSREASSGIVLYAYFDLTFIQLIETDEHYETMETLQLGGKINGIT